MSEYVPLEIQAEILKRLPVKPLLQFRSVSKPWKSLIDSPDFIVSYGVRRPPPPDDRLILRYKPTEYDHNRKDQFLTFVDNDNENDTFIGQDFVFGPTISDLVKKFGPLFTREVGSSHGLLCFNILSLKNHPIEMVILWNPSIRKYVGIEQPVKFDDDSTTIRVNNVIGFGVCPVTLDPTIIKIRCIDYERKMQDMPGISVPWKVGVFSLSTGAWSILSTNLSYDSISLEGSQVVVDRFVYWVGYDTLDAGDGSFQSRCLIMSFDLTAKEFEEINLTESLANGLLGIPSISKLRESLVLLAYHGEDASLWTLINEKDAHRSFTKLYNINLLPDGTIYQLLGFRKTGELILATKHNEGYRNAKVEMYNPNSERNTNLGIAGKAFTFLMCSYMETLLLLQCDGDIYSNS